MKKRLVSFFAIVVLLVCTIVPCYATTSNPNECILYKLRETPDLMEVFLDYNGKELKHDSTIDIKYGDYINVSATPNTKVDYFYYVWDSNLDNMLLSNKDCFNLQMPLEFEAGSEHALVIGATFVNGMDCELKRFHFVIQQNDDYLTPEELSQIPSFQSNYFRKVDFTAEFPINSTFFLHPVAKPQYANPCYYWDDDETIEVGPINMNYRIETPADFEVGSTHTLTLYTIDEDDNQIAPKIYTITFTEAVDEFAVDENAGSDSDHSPDATGAPVINEELL